MAGIYDGHLNGSRPLLIAGQRRASQELAREAKASEAVPLASSAPALPYADAAAARHRATQTVPHSLPGDAADGSHGAATPPANLHLLWGRRGSPHRPQPPAPLATGRRASHEGAPPSPTTSHASDTSVSTQESVDFFGPFSPR